MNAEEKVYEAYWKTKKEELYFNELKDFTKLSNSSLQNSLNKLTKNKILEINRTKSNIFYKIRDKKIFSLRFSEIAIKKFKQLNNNVKVPLKNFLKNIPKDIYTIVLFGSASTNEETSDSDIDLLVVLSRKIDLQSNKREAEITSKHPISIFKTTISEFLRNKEDIVIQARKTGFPIYKEQNFYEVILDESGEVI